ncbi:MAG: adenylate/guanylate cyclase domain-containing protein, partial [Cyanobacteriota bacterium]|nr:adenylate/guanylate cyclase domain-containing protein [Cyanobacteriota bacterium]
QIFRRWVMAVFPDRADDAVVAGIAKLDKVREYNQKRLQSGYQPIKIGIGIHIGHVMVGIVGEAGRMEGDALSDNVNLTARLEGLTKFYGVSLLISEQVVDKMHDREKFQLRFLDRAIVKGRSEPISVYEVLDGETQETRELKLKTQPDFERGLEFYRRGELDSAKGFFERVLQVNSLDKTAQLYLERIDRLKTLGLPEQWNGTWRFTEK